MLSIFKLKKKTAGLLKNAALLGMIASPCLGTDTNLQIGVWKLIPSIMSSADSYNALAQTIPQIRGVVKENEDREILAASIDATWRYDYTNVMTLMRTGQKDALHNKLKELAKKHTPAEYNDLWWFEKHQDRFDEVFQNHVYPQTTEALMDQFRNTDETPLTQFLKMAGCGQIKKNQLYVVHVQKRELSRFKTQLQSILECFQARICFNVDFSNEAGTVANLSDTEVPNNVQFLSVKGDNITSIGDVFLNRCALLKIVDLSGLSNITQIGNNFLSFCASLQSIDLSGLSNITQIGNNFLSFCASLQSIDLSSLSNVTKIGEAFLSRCTSLKSIDLSALSNVTQVGDFSFSRCISLRSIDLSPLSNVTQVGRDVLRNCESLKSVDLSRLSKLTQLQHGFLFLCSALKTVTIKGSSEILKRDVREFKCKAQLSHLTIIDEAE